MCIRDRNTRDWPWTPAAQAGTQGVPQAHRRNQTQKAPPWAQAPRSAAAPQALQPPEPRAAQRRQALHRPEYPAAAACSHPVARQQKPARAGRAFLPEFRNRTRPLRKELQTPPSGMRDAPQAHRRNRTRTEPPWARAGQGAAAPQALQPPGPRAAQQQWVPHRPENPETAARSRPAVWRQEPARAFLPEFRNQTRPLRKELRTPPSGMRDAPQAHRQNRTRTEPPWAQPAPERPAERVHHPSLRGKRTPPG